MVIRFIIHFKYVFLEPVTFITHGCEVMMSYFWHQIEKNVLIYQYSSCCVTIFILTLLFVYVMWFKQIDKCYNNSLTVYLSFGMFGRHTMYMHFGAQIYREYKHVLKWIKSDTIDISVQISWAGVHEEAVTYQNQINVFNRLNGCIFTNTKEWPSDRSHFHTTIF